jgi:hypothetical protein
MERYILFRSKKLDNGCKKLMKYDKIKKLDEVFAEKYFHYARNFMSRREP